MNNYVPHASKLITTHPCFSKAAHNSFGRICLPVARDCNIQCGYCTRKCDCINESGHGLASRILSPTEALERVMSLTAQNHRISVICIAGPGDSLANETTFETLQSIYQQFPNLILCISTNGLMLHDRLEALVKVGVRALTITINAVTLKTAEKIYSRAFYHGKWFEGRAAADIILMKQWQGFLNAIDAGMIVKVNTVLIPEVNDQDITFIAEHAGHLGADAMHIVPLIPQGEFKHIKPPAEKEILKLREQCNRLIPQINYCKECGSNDCGIKVSADGTASPNCNAR